MKITTHTFARQKVHLLSLIHISRTKDAYRKIAEYFKVDMNYLLTEDEEFVVQASEQYGSRGMKQAKDLIEGTVSYTHLDVYKRQVLYTVLDLVRGLLRLEVYQTAGVLPVFEDMNDGCLLYTSRCV